MCLQQSVGWVSCRSIIFQRSAYTDRPSDSVPEGEVFAWSRKQWFLWMLCFFSITSSKYLHKNRFHFNFDDWLCLRLSNISVLLLSIASATLQNIALNQARFEDCSIQDYGDAMPTLCGQNVCLLVSEHKALCSVQSHCTIPSLSFTVLIFQSSSSNHIGESESRVKV